MDKAPPSETPKTSGEGDHRPAVNGSAPVPSKSPSEPSRALNGGCGADRVPSESPVPLGRDNNQGIPPSTTRDHAATAANSLAREERASSNQLSDSKDSKNQLGDSKEPLKDSNLTNIVVDGKEATSISIESKPISNDQASHSLDEAMSKDQTLPKIPRDSKDQRLAEGAVGKKEDPKPTINLDDHKDKTLTNQTLDTKEKIPNHLTGNHVEVSKNALVEQNKTTSDIKELPKDQESAKNVEEPVNISKDQSSDKSIREIPKEIDIKESENKDVKKKVEDRANNFKEVSGKSPDPKETQKNQEIKVDSKDTSVSTIVKEEISAGVKETKELSKDQQFLKKTDAISDTIELTKDTPCPKDQKDISKVEDILKDQQISAKETVEALTKDVENQKESTKVGKFEETIEKSSDVEPTIRIEEPKEMLKEQPATGKKEETIVQTSEIKPTTQIEEPKKDSNDQQLTGKIEETIEKSTENSTTTIEEPKKDFKTVQSPTSMATQEETSKTTLEASKDASKVQNLSSKENYPKPEPTEAKPEIEPVIEIIENAKKSEDQPSAKPAGPSPSPEPRALEIIEVKEVGRQEKKPEAEPEEKKEHEEKPEEKKEPEIKPEENKEPEEKPEENKEPEEKPEEKKEPEIKPEEKKEPEIKPEVEKEPEEKQEEKKAPEGESESGPKEAINDKKPSVGNVMVNGTSPKPKSKEIRIKESARKEPPTSKDSGGESAKSPTKSPISPRKPRRSTSPRKSPTRQPSPTKLDPGTRKLPPIKAPVGNAPMPNLKNVKSKIGSFDNIKYKSKCSDDKVKKVVSKKLEWKAAPKVGSLDNAHYRPGGGDKKIQTVKLDFKERAHSRLGGTIFDRPSKSPETGDDEPESSEGKKGRSSKSPRPHTKSKSVDVSGFTDTSSVEEDSAAVAIKFQGDGITTQLPQENLQVQEDVNKNNQGSVS